MVGLMLGLAMAGAVGLSYSNIFVTAPSLENLTTLLLFVPKVRGWREDSVAVGRERDCRLAPMFSNRWALRLGDSRVSTTVPLSSQLGLCFPTQLPPHTLPAAHTFTFPVQGLDALEYKEHIDYDLVESTNPAWGKAVVRVNIYRNHRQVRCMGMACAREGGGYGLCGREGPWGHGLRPWVV